MGTNIRTTLSKKGLTICQSTEDWSLCIFVCSIQTGKKNFWQ